MDVLVLARWAAGQANFRLLGRGVCVYDSRAATSIHLPVADLKERRAGRGGVERGFGVVIVAA